MRVALLVYLCFLAGCGYSEALQRERAERLKQKETEAKADRDFKDEMAALDKEQDERFKRFDEENARIKALQEANKIDRAREGRTSMRSGLFGEGEIEGRIIQIIDNNNMLIAVEGNGDRVDTGWLIGFPTVGLVDGAEIGGIHVVVDGTKRYESALGVRTVPLLKCVAEKKP